MAGLGIKGGAQTGGRINGMTPTLYWLLGLQTKAGCIPLFALSYWNPTAYIYLLRRCVCRYVYAVHPAVGGVCSH